MMNTQHADIKTASLALTAFWAMVTVGRLVFSCLPVRPAFHVLPFIVALAFLLLFILPQGNGVLYFALAGFGCSALLPLIISFGEKALPSILSSVAGGLIAFYLLGYGIAAFGVGPLSEYFKLTEIFGLGAGLSIILGSYYRLTVKKEQI